MNPLDRPIWQALSTRQRPGSIGGDRARTYPPDIGPLAATVDDTPASLADLALLVAASGPLGLLQVGNPPLPPGCREDRRAPAVQMILTAPERLPDPSDDLLLGDADAADMLDLARLTAPGPFAARTHTLGRFFGVRVDGRLVAMAGERMRFPGFTEVSGVCTHPDFRGRGLSAALCARVIAGIRERGEEPFLHAFADNHAAVALYVRLGFVIRTEVTFVRLAPA
jgi:ribosomal protein S18 acetylase RimI-like enzyme